MQISRIARLAAAVVVVGLAAAQSFPTLVTSNGLAPTERLGAAVALLGDVDGDGTADYVAGGPFSDLSGVDRGIVRVISGATGALIRSTIGSAHNDQFGSAVAAGADVDGDLIPDYAGGEHRHDGLVVDAGRVRVFSGATGATIHVLDAGPGQSWFGYAIALPGDLDGDGRSEIVVGAPFAAGSGILAGEVSVFSGATGSLLYTLLGSRALGLFGWCVAALGDIDLDGRAEILVGAPAEDGVVNDSGRAHVFSGAAGAPLATIDGDAPFDNFGWAVADAGDVNGDSMNDILVGAPTNDVTAPNAGSARLSSGAGGGLLRIMYGDAADDRFGSSLTAAGDFDGDGITDHAIGAPLNDVAGPNAGSVRLISGAAGLVVREIRGNDAGDEFGTAVASGGDQNGDGFAEVLIGAPLDEPGGIGSGRIEVRAVTGADTYGVGAHGALAMGYIFGMPPANRRTGFVTVSGGTNFGAGLVVASLAADMTTLGSPAVPILVDVDPPNFIGSAGVTYSAGGNLIFFLSLHQPFLDGFRVYFQAFDFTNFPPAASDGLELLFSR